MCADTVIDLAKSEISSSRSRSTDLRQQNRLGSVRPSVRQLRHARLLPGALEEHLVAPEELRRESLRSLTILLKKAIDEECYEEVAQTLRRAIVPTLDYTSAQSLYRIYSQIREHLSGPRLKLAVLSNVTSGQLTQLVELYLFAAGIQAEIYQADYGCLRQEILDGQSGLYAFQPKVIFLASNWRDLAHSPQVSDSRDAVAHLVESEMCDWAQLWKMAHDRLGCQILQNNFDAPPWRVLSNHELRHPGGLNRYISLVNHSLADQAPAYVTVHDLQGLAASAGLNVWGDERFFHQAKMPCAPECLTGYGHSVASVIAAQMGVTKKCLVLDLDNTLWGGVIGDDGLGGIRLGQGDAESEAFQAFQRYVKGLNQRGVILAVCSKNEDRIAREVFEKHSGMVLRLSDISCFVANWTDKAANLRTIAQHLNIGLNSLVFVDDNPAERAIVRGLVPEVAVPELPVDPAGYISALESHRYFEVTSLGEEDLKRTEYYRSNAAREHEEASASNVEDFLGSLRMVARIEPVDETSLERTAQLIGRSNQFNLTTRRYSAAQVLAMTESADWITTTVSLTDRFGDNGLISVLLAKIEQDALRIDTWLMSCRVLKRGVEDLLLNHLCEAARAHGLAVIRGEYIPTAKNALVKDHYARLGFEQVGTGEDGTTSWELRVDRPLAARTHFIQQKSE